MTEGAAVNSEVATISAEDPDQADNGRIVFLLALNPMDAFVIQGNRLLVKTPSALDRTKATTLTIKISAKDAGGLSLTEDFVISVLDANDPPTDLALSAYSFNENVPKGTPVASISAQDKDVGQKHVFEVVSPKDLFEVTGGSQLILKKAMDFEQKSSVKIEIKVTDNGLPPLSTASNFTLRVSRFFRSRRWCPAGVR